jgi:hypothetical protein
MCIMCTMHMLEFMNLFDGLESLLRHCMIITGFRDAVLHTSVVKHTSGIAALITSGWTLCTMSPAVAL